MTLKEFFDLLSNNPSYILSFFLLVPIAALIGTIIGKGEEEESVWQGYYSILIFLVAIPGIFAITLSIYLFTFERSSIFDTDIYTQILPILSMIATIFIIKRTVSLDTIPGFGKLSGLIMMIGATLITMWVLEKTHIVVFSYIPVQYAMLFIVGLMLVFRLGWSKVT